MYDLDPWDSVAGHGAEREPESAAAVANRATGDASPWYVGARYVADVNLAARARQLEQERAARDAARRLQRAHGPAAGPPAVGKCWDRAGDAVDAGARVAG